MATFTVYVPPGSTEPRGTGGADGLRAGRVQLGERSCSVRWPYCIRRLWLAAAAWMVVAAALGLCSGGRLHLLPGTEVALFLLLAALTGLETSGLRQRSLDRRGFVATRPVVAALARGGGARLFRGGIAAQKTPATPCVGDDPARRIRGLDTGERCDRPRSRAPGTSRLMLAIVDYGSGNLHSALPRRSSGQGARPGIRDRWR